MPLPSQKVPLEEYSLAADNSKVSCMQQSGPKRKKPSCLSCSEHSGGYRRSLQYLQHIKSPQREDGSLLGVLWGLGKEVIGCPLRLIVSFSLGSTQFLAIGIHWQCNSTVQLICATTMVRYF